MARKQTYDMQWKVDKARRDKRAGVTKAIQPSEYLKQLFDEVRWKNDKSTKL
ncbi:hypothetical protein [Halobacillus ihumii]|uniref:hypothetical protein n=1 Tax=Halobacillus ihumii TaxID=2686092 RepID=UPI0013D7A384|nr:hypothetical protein [Halobacillus ihumii]